MNTNNALTPPKFRENAVTAVTRDRDSITIWVRETTRKDGETTTVSVLAPITLSFSSLSDSVRSEAMGYGMEVRLTRAAAIEKDPKSGKSASAAEKHEAIRKLAEHYASGTDSWAMSGAGGGGLNADTTALIDALSRALGLDIADAEQAVREMTSDQRAALRLDEEIKPHLDAVYAERAKRSGTDTKALLGKLKAR